MKQTLLIWTAASLRTRRELVFQDRFPMQPPNASAGVGAGRGCLTEARRDEASRLEAVALRAASGGPEGPEIWCSIPASLLCACVCESDLAPDLSLAVLSGAGG